MADVLKPLRGAKVGVGHQKRQMCGIYAPLLSEQFGSTDKKAESTLHFSTLFNRLGRSMRNLCSMHLLQYIGQHNGETHIERQPCYHQHSYHLWFHHHQDWCLTNCVEENARGQADQAEAGEGFSPPFLGILSKVLPHHPILVLFLVQTIQPWYDSKKCPAPCKDGQGQLR